MISVGVSATPVLAVHCCAVVVALRQSEDPWISNPLALLMVIPCLVHDMSEASIGDFLGMVGLFSESLGRRRTLPLLVQEQAEAAREEGGGPGAAGSGRDADPSRIIQHFR